MIFNSSQKQRTTLDWSRYEVFTMQNFRHHEITHGGRTFKSDSLDDEELGPPSSPWQVPTPIRFPKIRNEIPLFIACVALTDRYENKQARAGHWNA